MATEREVLHMLAALVYVNKPEVCVETGTFFGHGTKAIANALEANEKGHLWTVEYSKDIAWRLENAEVPRTTFVTADSVLWSASGDCPINIDFAFVDCCEHPTDRVQVFSNLLPRMRDGGTICVHDSEFYRYEDYLDRLTVLAPYSMHFPALNGFTVWQR